MRILIACLNRIKLTEILSSCRAGELLRKHIAANISSKLFKRMPIERNFRHRHGLGSSSAEEPIAHWNKQDANINNIIN